MEQATTIGLDIAKHCFRCMEWMPPGMCCFASASLARCFSVSSQRKPDASSRWKLVPVRTTTAEIDRRQAKTRAVSKRGDGRSAAY